MNTATIFTGSGLPVIYEATIQHHDDNVTVVTCKSTRRHSAHTTVIITADDTKLVEPNQRTTSMKAVHNGLRMPEHRRRWLTAVVALASDACQVERMMS